MRFYKLFCIHIIPPSTEQCLFNHFDNMFLIQKKNNKKQQKHKQKQKNHCLESVHKTYTFSIQIVYRISFGGLTFILNGKRPNGIHVCSYFTYQIALTFRWSWIIFWKKTYTMLTHCVLNPYTETNKLVPWKITTVGRAPVIPRLYPYYQ